MSVEAGEAALGILVVAVVTYATRLVGLFLGGVWAEKPFWREALTVLPACALLGVVVPGLRAGDGAVWAGTVVTVLAYWWRAHLPSALLAGFVVLFTAAWLKS